MTALNTNKKEIANIVNKYVADHGDETLMSKSELDKFLEKNGIVLDTMYQPSDMCYNMTNIANFKTFREDVLCFVRVKYDLYRLVGENYPYTGEVFWYPKGKEPEILGEWLNGDLIVWEARERVKQNENSMAIITELEKIERDVNDLGIIGTEKSAMVRIRINQSEFRKRLLKRYSTCCILNCNVSNDGLLIAGHIKPWAVSAPDERVDVNNGFLFCPNHDRLFDKGWISFEDDGRILISSQLSQMDKMFMNVDEKQRAVVCEQNKPYLKYHRENVFMGDLAGY